MTGITKSKRNVLASSVQCMQLVQMKGFTISNSSAGIKQCIKITIWMLPVYAEQ